jgi:NADH:ubiquinone oxidoreductase subunit 2 (subunit N)
MTPLFTAQDWNAVAPLFIVGCVALVVLLADLVAPKHANRYVSIGIGIAGLAAAGVYAGMNYYSPAYDAFGGGFIRGGFTVVFEEIVVIAAIVSLALYGNIGREDRMAGITALLIENSWRPI